MAGPTQRNALASVDDHQSVEELTAEIQRPISWNQLRMRSLRPWAEDKPLRTAINHGEFLLNGFRNRDPQDRHARGASPPLGSHQPVRAHGLIQKVPRTHRCHVTESGRAILVAVLTSARTSVHQLNQLAQAACNRRAMQRN